MGLRQWLLNLLLEIVLVFRASWKRYANRNPNFLVELMMLYGSIRKLICGKSILNVF